ncbi:DNA polymerase III epsilon subunit-like exonuclease [Leishmania tarentolae]|uniref:DNA polymerase III epsilon subunit-like exonuclease n=1 Tax=Leishmania tarentolae TaxID=5689 RepID=A0A640KQ50_LEITA|nr:DNA polymerase III epsilon subunit-like exonuclease [Leishmania tarentolae]
MLAKGTHTSCCTLHLRDCMCSAQRPNVCRPSSSLRVDTALLFVFSHTREPHIIVSTPQCTPQSATPCFLSLLLFILRRTTWRLLSSSVCAHSPISRIRHGHRAHNKSVAVLHRCGEHSQRCKTRAIRNSRLRKICMDDLSAAIRRFRERQRSQRSHQDAAAKERAQPGKVHSKPTATLSSTQRGITSLIEMWMGDQGQQTPHRISDTAPHSSDSTYLSSSSPHLVVSLSSNMSYEKGESASSFAPVSPRVPPLLADTIGLLAPLREGQRALASPLVSHLSTPVVASASAAGCRSVPFSCVVVDLETTGFSATKDEILEVGCVELRWTPPSHMISAGSTQAAHCATLWEEQSVCGVIEGLWTRGGRVFHRYVRPSDPRSISAAATAVHGITWEMVQHFSPWPVVASELVAYMALIGGDALVPASAQLEDVQLGGYRAVHLPPLVAHNASFDARFLEHHLRRCGYQIFWNPQYSLTCTRQWAQVAYPHLASNLDALCAFLSIDGAAARASNGHSALTDATLTALLFLQMCRRWTARFGGGEKMCEGRSGDCCGVGGVGTE